jgi:TPP-dependent pyruvate/acetoin dehydrogenase alpha subunit
VGRVLSIDLAYRRLRDFGICLLEERKGRVVNVRFVDPDQVFNPGKEPALTRPPPAKECATAISAFCGRNKIRVLLLDGPQGWKDPKRKASYRLCEKLVHTPAKTGVNGQVIPRSYTGFVEFSTQLFLHLVDLGGLLVSHSAIRPPKRGSFLVAESFPLSAWRKLRVAPLPAKKKATNVDVQERLHALQNLFGLAVPREPNHDELQALVAGLAGVAILNGDTDGYIAEGARPKKARSTIVEGYIVNPRLKNNLSAPALGRATQEKTTPYAICPDSDTLQRMLYYLKLTRAAEWRIEQVLYRQGKIVGGVYVGRGQEAITVGAAIQLTQDDVVVPTHRDFAAFLVRGFSLQEILSNWMGRAEGPTRGRDGSLHFGDMKRGVVAIISHLGSWCPVACGVALALKRRGKGNVVVAFFGEGTSSEGDVHEAMNLAAVMKLPVAFVCNNNQYAYSTPPEKQYAVKSLAVRGPAYGMPGETLDGNDVLAVYDAVQRAIIRARAGHGPSLLECKTFRMTGHSAHDAAEYVPEKLWRVWKKRDPIKRFEKFLLARKILTKQRIEELELNIQKEIDGAVADAESRPLPADLSVREGVYCDEDCWWKKPWPVS